MKKIAIIGAGLSGLTAAHVLKNHADITLFEKARGVSGRMSTRWAEPYFFDHGAQFFKAKTDAFKTFITPMIQTGVIKHWDARVVKFENKKITHKRQWNKDDPHYVGVPSMNAVAKYIAQDLNVQLGTCVQSICKSDDKWLLSDDQNNSLGEYDWLISAIPPEQAAKLLPTNIPFHKTLNKFKMQGCFTLMLGFEKPLTLEFDAAFVQNKDISWIAVNNSKPNREKGFSLLVHSSHNWADKHIDDNLEDVMAHLCEQASEIIGHDLDKANHKAIHVWRFANIGKKTGATHFIDENQNIAVCGDWFIKGHVEAAFTSGYESAHQVLKLLKPEGNDV
ncbi:MAG: renalase [Alphaproteobacteria bacterium]|jgi:renalase